MLLSGNIVVFDLSHMIVQLKQENTHFSWISFYALREIFHQMPDVPSIKLNIPAKISVLFVYLRIAFLASSLQAKYYFCSVSSGKCKMMLKYWQRLEDEKDGLCTESMAAISLSPIFYTFIFYQNSNFQVKCENFRVWFLLCLWQLSKLRCQRINVQCHKSQVYYIYQYQYLDIYKGCIYRM